MNSSHVHSCTRNSAYFQVKTGAMRQGQGELATCSETSALQRGGGRSFQEDTGLHVAEKGTVNVRSTKYTVDMSLLLFSLCVFNSLSQRVSQDF